MKKLNVISAAVVLFCAMLLNISSVAAADKIAVISFQKVLTQSKAGQAALTKLQEEGKKIKADFDAEVADLKRLQQESMITSGEKRKEILKEMGQKNAKLEGDQKKYAQQLRESEMKALSPIRKRIIELVREKGEKKKYTLILEKREAGVVYAPDSIDISDEILKQMDSEYK